MAFGQPSGPPASHRQVEDLLALVVAAGYDSFREARHPLGLTQRQAAGRFTRDEADELAARLRDGSPAADGPAPPRARPGAARRRAGVDLGSVPAEDLAAELQGRGWVVMEP